MSPEADRELRRTHMKWIFGFVVIMTISVSAYAQTGNSDAVTQTPTSTPATVPTLTPMRGPNGERPTPTTPSPTPVTFGPGTPNPPPPGAYYSPTRGLVTAEMQAADAAFNAAFVAAVASGLCLILNVWYSRRLLREITRLQTVLQSGRES